MIDTPYFFVFYDKIWRKMTFLMKGTRSGTHFWDFDSNKYRKRPTQLRKKRIFLILIFLTFCLIVSWVFDLETIAGCLIFAFGPRISNLFLDLREIYRADCQSLVLSAWSVFERASNFKVFVTTNTVGVLFKSFCLRDLFCVTLKSVRKYFFWKRWN